MKVPTLYGEGIIGDSMLEESALIGPIGHDIMPSLVNVDGFFSAI